MDQTGRSRRQGAVILAGVRSFEPGQREYVEQAGLRWYGVEDLEQALDGLTGPVYVHVDLDVLDPEEFGSTRYPEPDGVPLRRLIDLVSRVENVVGASITEHAPSGDADDAGDADVIRRLGSALRR